ncbi:unnamed protein product, partial [Rotaria sp. Silwood1]
MASGNYELSNGMPIDNSLSCTICDVLFENPRCTPCKHTFCGKCINQWIKQGNESCPTCGKSISQNDLTKAPKAIQKML